jgi:DNA-binding MarR family transcriptional regulator
MKKLALHLFMHIGKLLEDEMRVGLARHGISHGQARILRALARFKSISQTRIARTLNIKPPTVSRMIAAMERDGLVGRTPDPKDVRAITVTLTPKGTRAAATVQRVWDRTEKRLMSSVPPAKRKGLHKSLLSIRNHMGGRSPDWGALSDGNGR